jgi:hypothetical protein
VKRWDYLILVSKEAFDFNSTVSTLGFNFALRNPKGILCVNENCKGEIKIKIGYPMGNTKPMETRK